MKVTYDKQADAMYLYLSRGAVKKTIPVNDRVIVDVGERGKIIGVELLFVSERMPRTHLKNGFVGEIERISLRGRSRRGDAYPKVRGAPRRRPSRNPPIAARMHF